MKNSNDKEQEVIEVIVEEEEQMETPLNEEEIVVDTLIGDISDEYEDNEVEGRSYLMIALYGAVVLILIGMGLLFYRYYPLNSKIAGTWTGESLGAQYKIENSKDISTFTILNSNNTNGMDIVFQSQLTKEASNEYFVKDTQVFLRLNYEKLGAENIQNFVNNKDMFSVVVDDNKTALLAYTKEGIESTFGDKDLDTLFKYVLRDFKWTKMSGDVLNVRNDSFAQGGISFKREK